MSVQEVRPADATTAGPSERARVIVLGGLILGALAVYVVFRASDQVGNAAKNLLPYQTLARTLPDAEQETFRSIRQGLLEVEAQRARLSRWPLPAALASAGVAPFSNEAVAWHQFTQGVSVSYLGVPSDPGAPAWMLTIQEPEPNAPPDPSPNDDEHHRLPDGTTLHIYVWMHQYGGRVKSGFVPQPQTDGWTQVFSSAPNPILPPRSA